MSFKSSQAAEAQHRLHILSGGLNHKVVLAGIQVAADALAKEALRDEINFLGQNRNDCAKASAAAP